ncbi:MAG: HAMP domain-containing sensor histidine kinase [Bacillota bacterium]
MFGFSVMYYIEDFFVSQKEKEILYNLNQIKDDLHQPVLNDNDDRINDIMRMFSRLNKGQIWLTDSEGKILNSLPTQSRNNVAVELIDGVLEGNMISTRVESQHFERPMLLNGIPLTVDSQKYSLLFFSSVEGINSSIDYIQKLMLYISGFSIILAAFISFFWSKNISSPIEKVSRAALKISEGEFIEVSEENTTKELSDLSQSINYMSKRLRENLNEILEEKNKLNYILTGMEEGVLALNNQKEIILVNQSLCDFFAFKQDDLLYRNYNDVINDKKVNDLIEKTIKYSDSFVEEFKLENKNKTKYFLIHSTAIFNEQTFWGVVLIFQDISERWRFEKLQTNFVANVSHELKTPLSSIRGAAEVMFDGAVTSEKGRKKYLAMIIEESLRLEKMVNNILDLSELKEKSSLNAEEIDISKFITSTINSYMSLYKVNQKIDLDIEKNIRAEINKKRIKRVIFNLLENAVKYSPDDGVITVSLKHKKGKIKFSVKDQGPGVPEDEKDNIWERFYKINNSESNKKKSGRGLGLAIVKDIIELHGGEVYQRNLASGGSDFGFFLK